MIKMQMKVCLFSHIDPFPSLISYFTQDTTIACAHHQELFGERHDSSDVSSSYGEFTGSLAAVENRQGSVNDEGNIQVLADSTGPDQNTLGDCENNHGSIAGSANNHSKPIR